MKKHVMVVDDDPCLCAVLDAELAKRDYRATLAQSPSEALELLAAGEDDVDIILTDFQMQGASGADLCARIGESDRFIPVVVMTSFGSMDTAVAAIRAGAYDYVTKPLDLDDLTMTLERGIKERALRAEVRTLRLGLQEPTPFEEMVGASPEMARAFELIERVASSDTTVLITGESGTGKELVARALHEHSSRKDKPFIKVNCAAIPKELIESELFGYERGAFTGAVASKPGRFELANGGTLFLDEIGEIPIEMQVKLLRALQESEFERVGGIKTIRFDVRLVAATNRDLKKLIASGNFREDLFYRLNVVPIRLPALRERTGDIPLLVEHFLVKFNERLRKKVEGVDTDATDVLVQYPWPGNIRELENVIEHAVLFCDESKLHASDLPPDVRGIPVIANVPLPEADLHAALAGEGGLKEHVKVAMSRLEKELVSRALQQTSGNVTHAARLLKISRKGLQLKMKELGLREGSGEKSE
jgi:two-component system, NtrC family, response regulator AtoC